MSKNPGRKVRRAAGLCPECGVIPGPPFATCNACRTRKNSLRSAIWGPDVSRAVDARLKASKRCDRCLLLMEPERAEHVCIGSSVDYGTPQGPWEGA